MSFPSSVSSLYISLSVPISSVPYAFCLFVVFDLWICFLLLDNLSVVQYVQKGLEPLLSGVLSTM